METLYFEKNNEYHKIEYDYDTSPDNPRQAFDNLGKMVFKNFTRNRLGDEQTSDFHDFFLDELTGGVNQEGKWFGKFTVKIPSIVQVQNHRVLSKLYLAGNEEIGFHVDVEKLNQDMEAQLSNLCEQYREFGYIDDITCGIPLDKNNNLTDKIEIECSSPFLSHDDNGENFSEAYEAVKATIECFDMNYSENCFYLNKSEVLTEKELFEEWTEKQFFVLPINIYEHGYIVLKSSDLYTKKENYLDGTSSEIITNDGFIYVSKDNKEVLDYLASNSEEETKQWLERIFKTELEKYSNYLSGQVYRLQDSIFNKETLEWEKNNDFGNIYGDIDSFLSSEFGNIKYINQNEIQKLETTITPEYKKNIWNQFLKETKEALPDFDNNILYAQRSVLISWNKAYSNELFPNKIKIDALNEFLLENGCINPENTIKFLQKEIQSFPQKEFDPFSYKAEELGYETWLQPNSNKLASNYNSRVSPIHALIIDYQNKRFGILTGADSFNGDRLPNYKKNPLLSGKKFKEKIEKLLSEGFTFEKFTGNAECSQGKLERFFPDKKKLNSKENDYERGM